MKKNLIIIILAIAFITSFSWNWIEKARAKAQRDKVAETVEAINNYGGIYSGVAGEDGTFYLMFSTPPNQSPPSLMTVTITNIDENDIDFVIN